MSMPKVTGIGGVFFRAKNPELLSKWYADHLGVSNGPDGMPWQQAAGMTVFAPFTHESDYFPQSQSVMLNFRVEDLDALLDTLRANGVVIDHKRQQEAYGKFAWIYDPEGNKVELWEPLGA